VTQDVSETLRMLIELEGESAADLRYLVDDMWGDLLSAEVHSEIIRQLGL
jgi:hypothetical protein